MLGTSILNDATILGSIEAKLIKNLPFIRKYLVSKFTN